METVKWLPIPGYETYYEVSSDGQVRSVGYMSSKTMHYLPRNRPILLKQETTKDGYKRVVLCKDGCKRHFSVHRLVAMAFLLNPHNLPQVNHKVRTRQIIRFQILNGVLAKKTAITACIVNVLSKDRLTIRLDQDPSANSL